MARFVAKGVPGGSDVLKSSCFDLSRADLLGAMELTARLSTIHDVQFLTFRKRVVNNGIYQNAPGGE
jgi:hypothetical protein